MDFAENQLKKHGWKSGDGLGKERHGIKEPIKVKMKFDSTGVGHDAGQEFSFHWWDHVFNKAASNIQIEESNDGVEVKNTRETEVSKTKSKSYADKSKLYGQFVKGATLNGGSESRDPDLASDTSDDEQTIKHCLLPSNEEEVFKMCGGRTAHKGARHGLKLNGKLARIEEQEKIALEGGKHSPGTHITVPDKLTDYDDISQKKSKKKKRKLERKEDEDGCIPVDCDNAEDIQPKRQKKSKKKKKHERNIESINECDVVKDNLNHSVSDCIDPGDDIKVEKENSDIAADEIKSSKKKKKTKRRDQMNKISIPGLIQ